MPKSVETAIEKTYSINQVAKMLRRSHKKISDLVASGILKKTPDNRIHESSIREYNQK
ncbi:helix-turn-helix domain-containing protein [Dysgonomonas sp. ZJ279]|nr:helix-turn-helix domain-containing protein [Dysgonomonas sp. ZJ279]